MSGTRSLMVDGLKAELANPKLKKKYLESSRVSFKVDGGTRLFENYPRNCLISDKNFEELATKFQTILTFSILYPSNNEEELLGVLDPETKKAIIAFEKTIARMGMQEVLDNGKIKPEIIKLLHLENQVNDTLKVANVISAYVGTINLMIIDASKFFIICFPDNENAITDFINKGGYRLWVDEVLNEAYQNQRSVKPAVDITSTQDLHPARFYSQAPVLNPVTGQDVSDNIKFRLRTKYN